MDKGNQEEVASNNKQGSIQLSREILFKIIEKHSKTINK